MNIFDFFILLCFLSVSCSICKGDGDCSNLSPSRILISEQNVSQAIQTYSVPDSAVVISFSVTNADLDKTVATSFLDVEIDGNTLTISTTEQFGSFGEKVHTDGDISLLVLFISLNCAGQTVENYINVQVTDAFSRKLEFSSPSGYFYSLPMPIMPKIDISAYGEVISVYDVNFSNEDMRFSILPEDFEVTTVQMDERHFRAVLTPNRILQFAQNETYTLTAVDSGGQTESVQITIAVNASAGFDSPTFSRSFYSFSYSSTGQLTADDGEVEISSLKPNDSSYELGGDWASSFQASFNNSSQKFVLSISPIPLADLPAQILLTLSFATDVTTETVLIINVLELVPSFSNPFYQGIYDPDSMTIRLDQEIILQNAANVTLSNERLAIDPGSYAITPNKSLGIEDFDQYLKLMFTVTAVSATKDSSSAVVALSYVKRGSLHFDSPMYSAEYSEDGLVTFADGSHIGFEETTDFSAVEIAVGPDFSDNFEVSLSGSEWTVFVRKALSDETLDSKEQLIVPITATMSGLSASALLLLQLPTQRLIQFNQLYYSAEYSVKDSVLDSIKLNEPIAISGADPELIAVSFGDYEGYFAFNTTTNGVAVVKNLDTSPMVSPFIVVLTAYITSHPSSNATSLLVVDVDSPASQLEFVEKHYLAQYNPGTIELADKFIELQKVDNLQVDFAVEDYDDYFQIVPEESLASSYSIKVVRNLTSQQLSLGSLTLTITATSTLLKLTTFTVLILELPATDSNQPSFAQKHYAAQYSVDSSGNPLVTIDGDLIQLNNPDNLDLTFSFEGFDAFFGLEFDSAVSAYVVRAKQNLSEAVLDRYSELIMTVTAYNSSNQAVADTVVVLSLPTMTLSIQFEKTHYSAEYVRSSGEGLDTVQMNDGPIVLQLQNVNNDDVQFSFEGYEDYLKLVLTDEGSYTIQLKQNFDESGERLIISIVASTTFGNSIGNTVLILDMPATDSNQPSFAQKHYAAQYSVDSSGNPLVTIDGDLIQLNNPDNLDLTFSFEGFDAFFGLEFDSAVSAYVVRAKQNLSEAVLDSYSELIMTVTANNSSNQAVADTVVVLSLPTKTLSIQFEKTHYSAEYVRSSGEGLDTVQVNDGPIVLQLQNVNNDDLEFSFEGYDSYLKLVPDQDGSCMIQLLQNFNAVEQTLIINIMASTSSGDAIGSTVLVLNVPATEKSLKFSQPFYTGSYSAAAEPSIKLDNNINLTVVGYSGLQFFLGDFNNSFELQLLDPDTPSYGIRVKNPLEESVLWQSTELFIEFSAQDLTSGDNTSSVLILKLPLHSDAVFDSDHYEAEYVVSADGPDSVRLLTKISVKKPEYTQLTVPGYESHLGGSCEPTTLQCAISVGAGFNSSTLAATELLLTLTASNGHQSSAGSAVLLLQLPAKNASLQFSRPYYSAQYTIEKSATDLATLALFQDIAVKGFYSDDISITSDLPTYLEFSLVSSTWQVKLLKNFQEDVLAGNSTLIVSLAARGPQTFATAVLAIQLPDKNDIAFSALSYVAEYVLDGSPHVVLETEIETSQAEYSQIVLHSFTEHFELRLEEDSHWSIQIMSPLNSSILSQFSELQLTLTIYKVQVFYGQASLVMKLPNFSFSKDVYSATYTVDNRIASVSGDDFVLANSNPEYIHLNLTEYSEFFYTEAQEGSWSLKLKSPLPADVTQNHRALVTSLVAQRQSDGVVFASASLVINLPVQDSDEAPKFSNFTYFGEYLSTDPPAVQLKGAIEFATDNIATISKVAIDSYDEYSGNFQLSEAGSNRYNIAVGEPLDEQVLANRSSIVLTLVASSDQDLSSAAALVIALPKLMVIRNASVQVENQEVLFTASYANGSFTSPKILLDFTNDTADDDVSVKITNDMGLDSSYFHYTCSGHVLTIDVDELPEEVLNRNSMVALKLAITDRTTNDTIFAVVAVDIATDSEEETGSYAGRTALIVAVSLLAILLLLLLLAVFLYWLCVLRRTKQANVSIKEDTNKATIFTKKETKKPPSAELSQAALRRPTGLPAIVPQESLDNHGSYTDPDPEKSVGFDDNVEKIGNSAEDGEKLRSVADRRPTKFVFGQPLESGVLDPIADIPEERRRSLDLPDDKKKVAFDVENVERMDFEPVEEQDEEEEMGDTPENNVFKAEVELNIKADETQLPSQVLKEIF